MKTERINIVGIVVTLVCMVGVVAYAMTSVHIDGM